MEVPFDVIDHIFSFLHPKALIACSKAHPVLSQVAERYRFRHIIIRTSPATEFTYSFNPSDLRNYLAETPRVIRYVTVVQIEFKYYAAKRTRVPYLEGIASLLPMFPVLECIMLPTESVTLLWQEDLPESFRRAVENCLQLPTLQEMRIGNMYFPLSILDNHANIKHISLSGPPRLEPKHREATYPQLKSFALEGFGNGDGRTFRTWAKQHLVGLQSLKYSLSYHERTLKLVEICSDTLENLYLLLRRQEQPQGVHIDLSSLPRLQHLTIHTEIHFRFHSWGNIITTSFLPEVVDILETASSLQQLTIEIYIDPSLAMLDRVDLSPLRVLTESPDRFPHIDLYFYTGSPRLRITRTIVESLLAGHKGLVELTKRGVLVVHPGETAPTL